MSQIRVATTDDDYRDVNALLRSVNMPESELTFPTLLARQGDELVGALGTSIYGDNQAILSGPLVLRSDKRRPLLAWKLMTHYERAMLHLGIKSVILWCEAGGDLEKAMRKAAPDWRPYALRDGNSFYVWPIGRLGSAPNDLRARSDPGDGLRARSDLVHSPSRSDPPEQRDALRARSDHGKGDLDAVRKHRPTLADVLAKTNIPSALTKKRANSYRSA